MENISARSEEEDPRVVRRGRIASNWQPTAPVREEGSRG